MKFIILPIFKTVPILTATFSFLSLTSALYLFLRNQCLIMEWQLITITASPVTAAIILDPEGLTYLRVVLFISSNVIKFRKFYMAEDIFINRFTILVVLFVLSIRMLILIPNLIILLLGWDGLGITSFVLIIYYQNNKSLAAGIITALTNRIGDVIILIAIALTLNQGHWNIIHIWNSTYLWPQAILIIVAAITKRAQIPFSSWLPAAMAAPTPVSALVHSSTLVTAGVFLLIRFYPFLRSIPLFHFVLLFSAISTILIAGISATTECDIKKIIALSTLSQLGVIITRLGLGMPTLALFHIMTHALFKALLFICAGGLIGLHLHGQDLRWLGNLTAEAPVATSCILIANSALCGLPFMAGFYSKDLVIEFILINNFNWIVVIISFIAVGFTSFYSIRFRVVIAWGPRCHAPLRALNESYNTIIPIILISFTSVIGGASILWVLPPIAPSFMSFTLKLIPLLIVILGIISGWILSTYIKSSISAKTPINSYASCIIWFLVPLSSQYQLALPLKRGHTALKRIDHGWLELLGGKGINSSITVSGNTILKYSYSSPTSAPLNCMAGAITILCLWSLIYQNSLNKVCHWSWHDGLHSFGIARGVTNTLAFHAKIIKYYRARR